MTAIFAWFIAMTGVLTVVGMMWLFDLLVRWQYEHLREQWERDGKPDGYFWRAEECVFWRSGLARQQLVFVWLFKTPDWIAQIPECRRRLSLMRIVALAANLCILGLIIVLLR